MSNTQSNAIAGFIAGALGVLIVMQLAWLILYMVGILPIAPFPMNATRPLGVPQIISMAFWGGLWGVVYALFADRAAGGRPEWMLGVMLGVAASLVQFFIVPLIAGGAMAGGGSVGFIVVVLVLNGIWGIGTVMILPRVRAMLPR